MKRVLHEVKYRDGNCSIDAVPQECPCDPDGLETRLTKATELWFGFPCKQVGIPAEFIEVSMPDDYEPCGTCGQDHQYDGVGRECNPSTQKV